MLQKGLLAAPDTLMHLHNRERTAIAEVREKATAFRRMRDEEHANLQVFKSILQEHESGGRSSSFWDGTAPTKWPILPGPSRQQGRTRRTPSSMQRPSEPHPIYSLTRGISGSEGSLWRGRPPVHASNSEKPAGIMGSLRGVLSVLQPQERAVEPSHEPVSQPGSACGQQKQQEV